MQGSQVQTLPPTHNEHHNAYNSISSIIYQFREAAQACIHVLKISLGGHLGLT